MKIRLLIFYFIIGIYFTKSNAQNQLNDFYGQQQDSMLCNTIFETLGFATDAEVNNLISRIGELQGVKFRIRTLPCPNLMGPARALVYNGEPVIQYNPEELNQIKSLNFTTTNINNSIKWESIAILAHELGHHVNWHLTKTSDHVSRHEKELEADEYAGSVLYKLGATLNQAQRVMYSTIIPDEATPDHPGRKQRLEAIEKGWLKAQNVINQKYPMELSSIPQPIQEKYLDEEVDYLIKTSVKIGEQIWMSKNLNVTKLRNGEKIYEAKTNLDWIEANKNNIPAWSYYENDPAYGLEYGKIYNTAAIIKNICPEGWRVPNSNDWNRLFYANEILDLFAEGEWKVYGGGKNHTNKSGFGSLPGGLRYNDGKFHGINNFSIFAGLEIGLYGKYDIIKFKLGYNFDYNPIGYIDEDRNGFYIRCIKE
jgi:uncharacterized protein (TIGR02145 family)